MLKEILRSLKVLLFLSFLTGIAYPLLVTICGQILFKKQANGSLIIEKNTIKGSELIAQKFKQDKYFHSRPSSGDYATIPSGASNLGATSQALKEKTEKLAAQNGKDAPADMLTSSGSGLDPHISVAAAKYQILRVAKARNITGAQLEKLRDLVHNQVEGPDWMIFGNSRVNVLKLNLLLDQGF